jgi:nucleoside-diphosphate-sugar epimerase
MKILLCGARGFVGSHLQSALVRAGHEVIGGVSSVRPGERDVIAVDFARDVQAADWLPRVRDMDVVINAVGILRSTGGRPIQAVHTDTPKALFDACAQTGVPRVIQISALGIEHSPTQYAQTKLAAEQHLQALMATGRLSATILRPSIVFGRGGASSALFVNLARLPVALLPGPVIDAQVQPVAVTDLADAVVNLLNHTPQPPGPLACVGPQPVPLGDFIASLRQQLGHRPAKVLRLPDALTSLSAMMGDLVSASPWSSEAVDMLKQPNAAPPAAFEALLGRAGAHYSRLLTETWH